MLLLVLFAITMNIFDHLSGDVCVLLLRFASLKDKCVFMRVSRRCLALSEEASQLTTHVSYFGCRGLRLLIIRCKLPRLRSVSLCGQPSLEEIDDLMAHCMRLESLSFGPWV